MIPFRTGQVRLFGSSNISQIVVQVAGLEESRFMWRGGISGPCATTIVRFLRVFDDRAGPSDEPMK